MYSDPEATAMLLRRHILNSDWFEVPDPTSKGAKKYLDGTYCGSQMVSTYVGSLGPQRTPFGHMGPCG